MTKFMSKVEAFINRAVYLLKVNHLSKYVHGEDDIKMKFEKDIVKLLKKYELFTKKNCALRKTTIVVDVDKYPVVKMDYVLIERQEKTK